MNHFKMALVGAVTLVSLGISAPAFACGCEPPPPADTKGNNGWGNGPDSTNAGSNSGATAVTKSVNGPANDKFTGR